MQLGIHNGLPPMKKDILETTVLNILRNYNASMWLPGPQGAAGNYEDSSGKNPLATVNGLVGHVVDETYNDTAENAVKNSNFDNTVLGFAPPNWQTAAIAGMTTTFVDMGVLPSGDRYIDVRVTGTMGAAPGDIYFTEPNASAGNTYDGLVVGDLITASADLAIINGAYPSSGSVVLNCFARLASGAFGASSTATIPASALSSELQRFEASIVISNPLHVKGHMGVRLGGVANGTVIDITLRIARAQVQRGRNAAYIRTTENEQILSTNKTPVYQTTSGFKPTLVGAAFNQLLQSRSLSNWTVFGPATVAVDSGSAVDGSMKATRLTRTGATAHYLSRSWPRANVGATVYSGAIVAKPGDTGRYVNMRLQGIYPAFVDVAYDLTNGEIVNIGVLGGGVLVKADAVKLPNGYYCCRAVASIPASGGFSFVISTKHKIGLADGGADVGDSSDVLIDSTATAEINQYIEYPFPVNTTTYNPLAQAPYAWRFDGTDDRLVSGNVTIKNGNVPHFRVVCFKIPETLTVGADLLIAGTNSATASTRLAQLGLSATASLQASWTSDGGVGASPVAITRTLGEKIVTRLGRDASGNAYHTVRGDVSAPATVTSASVLGTTTADRERIGCHFPASEANFFTGDIYGIISGNGEPTADEFLAMENYLAGCAGFIPVP